MTEFANARPFETADAAAEPAVAPLRAVVERAQAGETAAFVELSTWYQRRVISTAWRILGNQADALDAAQEVFLRLHRYLRSFRSDQDFSAWLYRLIVNACHDIRRRRSGHLSFERERDRGTLDHLSSSDDVEASAVVLEDERLLARPWPPCRRRSGPPWCCAISRGCRPRRWRRSSDRARRRSGRRSASPGPSCGRSATALTARWEARGRERSPSTSSRSTDAAACPQNAGLLALHAGCDAPPEEVASLRRHVEECADCRRTLVELRTTRDWLRSNLTPPVDAALLAELRWRVVSRLSQKRPFPWPLAIVGRALSTWRRLGWQPVRGLAVAALLMVGALGALPSLDGGLPPPGGLHPSHPGARPPSPAMAAGGAEPFSATTTPSRAATTGMPSRGKVCWASTAWASASAGTTSWRPVRAACASRCRRRIPTCASSGLLPTRPARSNQAGGAECDRPW